MVRTRSSISKRHQSVLHLDPFGINNIGVMARGSVASGLLVNKSAKPYLNYSPDEVQKAAEAIKVVSFVPAL